jgi:hypothetical protein
VQLQRVSDHLYAYIDAAREEGRRSGPTSISINGLEMPTSRLPALHARLRIDVVALSQLDGLDLRGDIPAPGPGDRTSIMSVWTNAIGLLSRVAEAAEKAAKLTDEGAQPPRLP